MDETEKRLALWWALLVALTLVSFRGARAFASPALVAAAVLVIAFVKVRIVVRQFMEVRHAPIVLRLLLDAWVIAVCCALIAMMAAP